MKISFTIAGFLILSVLVFSGDVKAQSGMIDSAAEIQKATLESQRLMEEYKKSKQKIEDDLQQKLSVLTNSPADRARRRQLMEETNEKLSVLKRKFSADMEVLRSTRRDLLDNPSTAAGDRRKKKGFSEQELKIKIILQEEQTLKEKESLSPKRIETFQGQNNSSSIQDGNQNNDFQARQEAKTEDIQDARSKNKWKYQGKSSQ